MFTQESTKAAQTDIFAEEPVEAALWENEAPEKPTGLVVRIRDHDWTIGLLILLCDIVCWVVLYGVVGYVRRDQFFVSPFEFVIVDCISLLVLLQALYIVGGYNRNTETRGLTYTTQHILAIT